MREVPLMLIGCGRVGEALCSHLEAFNARSGQDLGFRIVATVRSARIERHDGTALPRHASDDWREVADFAFRLRDEGRDPVVIDVSDARNFVLHRMLIDAEFPVVTANKRPLTGSLDGFRLLTRAFDRRGHRAYWFEATVGGGLPVIQKIRELVETGDRITRITATLSGTLNFLCDAHAQRRPFGQALVEARDLGLMEPDPCEDLLCHDVVRKARILASLCGCWWAPEDAIAPVIAPELARMFGREIVEKLKDVKEWPDPWPAYGPPVDYVVRIEPTISGSSAIFGGLVPRDPARRPLEGPENRFDIETERNGPVPIVIRGPGAGAATTATAVFGDLLRSLARL